MFGVWLADPLGRTPAGHRHPAAADGAAARADGALRRLPRPRRPHRGAGPLPRGSGRPCAAYCPALGRPRAAALKPWARAVVTAWVLVVVPLLLFTLVLMVLTLPRVLATAWGACGNQAHALTVDWAGGDVAAVAVRMLAILAVSLPVLGSLLILVRLVRAPAASRVAGDRGHARTTAVAASWRPVALVAGPGVGLVAPRRPVPARSRPTSAARSSTGLAGVGLVGGPPAAGRPGPSTRHARCGPRRRRGRPRRQPAARARPGARAPRRPALTAARPAWVFPFNRPRPPERGTTRRWRSTPRTGRRSTTSRSPWCGPTAPACTNTQRGLRVRQLQRVQDRGRRLPGRPHRRRRRTWRAPEHLGGGQLQLHPVRHPGAWRSSSSSPCPGDLDADQHRRLDALWQQISAFAASIQHVPLDQVRNRLLAFQDQVRELVKEVGTPAPAASSTATPTGPGTATATPGAPRLSPSPTREPDAAPDAHRHRAGVVGCSDDSHGRTDVGAIH